LKRAPSVGLILFVAWLGWVFDIMDSALFAFAKVPMLTEMLGGKEAYKQHGPAIEGQIQTWFLIGWAIGGFGFGILADRWGRSRVLVLTILIFSIMTGLLAFAQTPEQVMLLRFLAALGIGGEWAAGASLVAEVVPDQFRAKAAAIVQSAAAFGPWFAALANLAVPAGDWRTLWMIGVLPAFVAVAIRFWVREPERVAKVREAQADRGDVRSLFRGKLLPVTIAAMVLGVVGVTGGGLVPFWLPNLVNEFAKGMPDEAKKNFLSYNTFTLHIGTLAGVIVFPLLSDRIGRRPAFAIFFAGAPLAMAGLTFGAVTLDRLLWMAPVAAFFALGLSAGFVQYFPELFPSHLRATGSGLAYNVGRIFSAPMPAVLGAAIAANGGNVAPVLLAAAGIFLIGLVVLPFAPETRGKELPA
jgi:MFS family permease